MILAGLCTMPQLSEPDHQAAHQGIYSSRRNMLFNAEYLKYFPPKMLNVVRKRLFTISSGEVGKLNLEWLRS